MKKLYRSDKNVIGAGVLGGVAEYYEIDPIIIRILAVFIALLTGIIPFALVYLLSVIVIPKRTYTEVKEEPIHTESNEPEGT